MGKLRIFRRPVIAPADHVLALHALAAMCPNCASGRAARGLVFSDTFWLNAWYTLLPFLVVALVVRWVVRRVDQGAGEDDPVEIE